MKRQALDTDVYFPRKRFTLIFNSNRRALQYLRDSSLPSITRLGPESISLLNSQINLPSSHNMSMTSTDCPVVPSQSTSSHFPPFLEWPAEIRNAIYEELFEHDEPLQLRYVSKSPTFQLHNDDGSDDVGRCCSIPGVNLLATCHQVHAEATPVLYARNTFAVADKYYILNLRLRDWLDQIGSAQKFLKEICCDLDKWSSFTSHAVFRLANILWERPGANFAIIITTVGGSSTAAVPLNRMLAALSPAAQDSQVKVIMRSPRSYLSGEIDRSASSVIFHLMTDAQVELDGDYLAGTQFPELKYDMSLTGQLERSFPQNPAPTVMDLIWQPLIMNRLMEHISNPQEDAVYDLDRHVMSRSLPAVLYVNRDFRCSFFELGTRKTHVAAMSTSTSTADFTRAYANLNCWQTDFRDNESHSVTPYRSESVSIALSFRLAELKSLGDLRFDVAGLVWASSSFWARTNIRVERFNNGVQVPRSEAVSPNLYHLRRALLPFLRDLLNRYPQQRYKPCPQIWADGFLRIREATFELDDGTTQTVVNEKYKFRSARISKEVKASLRQLLPFGWKPRLSQWARIRSGVFPDYDSDMDASDVDASDADDLDADDLDADASDADGLNADDSVADMSLLGRAKFLAKAVKEQRHPRFGKKRRHSD